MKKVILASTLAVIVVLVGFTSVVSAEIKQIRNPYDRIEHMRELSRNSDSEIGDLLILFLSFIGLLMFGSLLVAFMMFFPDYLSDYYL